MRNECEPHTHTESTRYYFFFQKEGFAIDCYAIYPFQAITLFKKK